MEAVLLALARLIQTIGRNILPSVILSIVILSLGFGVFVHFNLQHIVSRFPSVAEEQRTFDRSVVLNDLIITEIQDVVKTTASDRTNINQFRNGQFDINGVPFNFVAIAYSAASPGVTIDDRLSNPVPISIYNDFLPVMWHDARGPVCAKRDVQDISNPMLRFRMEQRGTQVIYACPIVTVAGASVGIITLEYLRRDAARPSDEVIYARMRLAASRTASYLLRISAQQR
jgi:hypothetical protein